MATDGVGLTDRRTVEAAKAGDEDAWRVLFDEHFAKVARFFRWRVASETVAEDLAAEVFADAYRGLGKFRWRNRPFEAWLFAIARNRLAMHYRKLRDEVELQPDTASRRNEFLAIEIRDVLDRLLEDYRTAIEYRYMVGLSGQEAAPRWANRTARSGCCCTARRRRSSVSIGEKTSLMRTRWTRRDVDERTDRELTRLFSDAAQRLEPDARVLRLAQARVARAEAESGGLRRRLALGTLGGGALWATALGSAAAHKAAAIAVVGGLLVGVIVAEQSGVAPAVRETIGIERAFDALTLQDDGATGAQDSGAATEIASPSATLPAAATSVHTAAAPEGLPGQLHTTLTPGGDFKLRAVLQGYGADSVYLYVADDEGGETVTLSLAPDAVLNVPGKPGEETGTGQLADYVGWLVVVHGHCDGAVEDLGLGAAGCSASRLQILGGPADSGPPADSSSSERGASEERGQGEANGGANGNSNAGGNASGGGSSNAGGDNANASVGGPKASDEKQGQPPEPAEVPDETAPNEPGPPEHSSAGGQRDNHSPE